MLKVLGSICVLGTSALLGIQKGAEIQRVYEELLYLQRLLYQMQSEIRYLRAPLGDIAGRIGRESRDPYKKWLLSLEREMKRRDGKSFSTLWEQGVRKHLGDLHFPEREISRLCALGSQIGNADMEFQMRTLSLYQEQLAQTLEELRRTIDGKVKLLSLIHIFGEPCIICRSGLFPRAYSNAWRGNRYKYFRYSV